MQSNRKITNMHQVCEDGARVILTASEMNRYLRRWTTSEVIPATLKETNANKNRLSVRKDEKPSQLGICGCFTFLERGFCNQNRREASSNEWSRQTNIIDRRSIVEERILERTSKCSAKFIIWQAAWKYAASEFCWHISILSQASQSDALSAAKQVLIFQRYFARAIGLAF
jgi:hypothetical protein